MRVVTSSDASSSSLARRSWWMARTATRRKGKGEKKSKHSRSGWRRLQSSKRRSFPQPDCHHQAELFKRCIEESILHGHFFYWWSLFFSMIFKSKNPRVSFWEDRRKVSREKSRAMKSRGEKWQGNFPLCNAIYMWKDVSSMARSCDLQAPDMTILQAAGIQLDGQTWATCLTRYTLNDRFLLRHRSSLFYRQQQP